MDEKKNQRYSKFELGGTWGKFADARYKAYIFSGEHCVKEMIKLIQKTGGNSKYKKGRLRAATLGKIALTRDSIYW